MRDFRDAKAMAQTLREALNARSVSLTHSESQELVAKILGLRDWNVLAARIQASQPVTAQAGTPVPAAVLPSSPAAAAIPVITMQDLVLFPHMTLSIFVGRDDTRRGVEFAMGHGFRPDLLPQPLLKSRPRAPIASPNARVRRDECSSIC